MSHCTFAALKLSSHIFPSLCQQMCTKNICCDAASDDYITDLGISKHSMLYVILCINLFKLLWKTDSSYHFGFHIFIS